MTAVAQLAHHSDGEQTMKVSGLDRNNDWRFGRGHAVYIQDSDAIRQNVATRIRSFAGDWFLDVTANIPWIELLGRRDSREQVLREVERVTLSTEGVVRILHIEIEHNRRDRVAVITLGFEDIFNVQQTISEPIEP